MLAELASNVNYDNLTVKNELCIPVKMRKPPVIHNYNQTKTTSAARCKLYPPSKQVKARVKRNLRFFIFCKNSRWPPKIVKVENFDISAKDSSSTLQVQNLLEIALSLTVFGGIKSYSWP